MGKVGYRDAGPARQPRRPVGRKDDGARAGVIHHKADFDHREQNVCRDHDGAEARQGVISDDPLPAVRQVENDAVPGADAQSRKTGGEAACERIQVSKAQRSVVRGQRLGVAVPPARVMGERRQGASHLRPS